MDEMTFIIGICLVLTGAIFFGCPLGYVLGRRYEADVLNAEMLEEVK